MHDRVVEVYSGFLPIQWKGRAAFFERSTGLVFVNTSVAQWKELGRAAIEFRFSSGTKKLLERLFHEFYHYLQFFGCGYMTKICADHFNVVRKAAPFPFTQSSLVDYLGQTAKRPEGLTAIARALQCVGDSEISPLHIIEGCAYLFQHLCMEPDLLHGKYLSLLVQSEDQDLYGRLYYEATHLIQDRALRETLFLGMCALEFSEPQHAIDVIMNLNAKLDPLSPDNLQMRHQFLIAEASKQFEYLGTAYNLAKAGEIYHPLLTQKWIYYDAPDWEATIGASLVGYKDNAIADCLRHAPVVLQDEAVHCPSVDDATTQAELEEEMVTLFCFASLSLRFDTD